MIIEVSKRWCSVSGGVQVLWVVVVDRQHPSRELPHLSTPGLGYLLSPFPPTSTTPTSLTPAHTFPHDVIKLPLTSEIKINSQQKRSLLMFGVGTVGSQTLCTVRIASSIFHKVDTCVGLRPTDSLMLHAPARSQ